jgi:hypothetical protein
MILTFYRAQLSHYARHDGYSYLSIAQFRTIRQGFDDAMTFI